MFRYSFYREEKWVAFASKCLHKWTECIKKITPHFLSCHYKVSHFRGELTSPDITPISHRENPRAKAVPYAGPAVKSSPEKFLAGSPQFSQILLLFTLLEALWESLNFVEWRQKYMVWAMVTWGSGRDLCCQKQSCLPFYLSLLSPFCLMYPKLDQRETGTVLGGGSAANRWMVFPVIYWET